MKTSGLILVVEDEDQLRANLVNCLRHDGYEVLEDDTGEDCLSICETRKPDVVILDIRFPGDDERGFEICRAIRGSADPGVRKVGILMLTVALDTSSSIKGFEAGADDHVTKPFDPDVLLLRLRALMRRAKSPPFGGDRFEDSRTMCLSLASERYIGLTLGQGLELNATTTELLKLDPDRWGSLADVAAGPDWHQRCSGIGVDLYRAVFEHPTVISNYTSAMERLRGDPRRLRLLFSAPREFLRVPLEFLFGNDGGASQFLAGRHPLARAITGVRRRRPGVSRDFLYELWDARDPLRVLLIASNVHGQGWAAIPGVDEEVSTVRDTIARACGDHIRVDIELIATNDASYDLVARRLNRCGYHIVHYAGHARFDRSSPASSHLLFWDQKDSSGPHRTLSAAQLVTLLEGSQVRLFYLSCCEGAKTGGNAELRNDDFLGIAEAIAQVGVPGVVGSRWPIEDRAAIATAKAFHEALFQQGDVDVALLHARTRVREEFRDDASWLAPLLIQSG